MPDSSTDRLVSRLGRLDTCAVSDALESAGRRGVARLLGPLWTGARLAGRVITVRVRPVNGGRAERHLGAAALSSAGPGDVVVVDSDAHVEAASWGGLLSLAALRAGVGGVVVDGACRDVDEIRTLGLPVFARGVSPRTARGRLREEATQEAVTVGGVTVHPGDLVIADGSGVVFIERRAALEVLETAERLAASERRMAAALEAGRPPASVLDRTYEEMLDGDAARE